MKTWLLLVFLSSFLSSCDKKEIGISYELKGQWSWKSTCGGIVGCVYTSQTTYRTMTITNSEVEKIDNGIITFKEDYQIKNVANQGDSKQYKIEFNDGTIWTCTVSDNNLTTNYASMIYSDYKRL